MRAKRKAGEEEGGKGSFCQCESQGAQKRAKGDPVLHLNGKLSPAAGSNGKQPRKADYATSEDPVMHPKNTTDRFIDMLETISDKDAVVIEKLTAAKQEIAQSATESTKAQVITVKAGLVKEVTSAVNAFVAAKTAGVQLPPGLLKLINGDV